MKQAGLKTIRLILASVFFLFLSFVFLDFREILPTGVIEGITFLQFVPSLLKFVAVLSVSAAGFIIVLVLTAFFGRVYCSVICPLGIFQDVISRIRKLTTRKHRYRYHRPRHVLRYFFLVLAAGFLVAGILTGIILMDPYSIFGRMVADIFQPVYIWINNRIAALLETMNIYVLFPEDIIPGRWKTYLIPAGTLGLVLWMSFMRGRLYCNTVCPVGTLLGLLSRFSVFRIRMIEEKCTRCAKCAIQCKAECIRVKDLEVDFSRCVGCYNCISVCPEEAIKYSFLPAWKSAGPPARFRRGRREAIGRMLAAGLALGGLKGRLFAQDRAIMPDPESKVENKVPTRIEPVKHFPVTPPGSLGIKHYTTRCTACHLCVSACPTDVLQPSVGEFGWSGLMQPHMDYSTHYCNFECVVCSEVCPSGAILSLTREAKKTTQLGQVHLTLENCVVYAEHTACGSCSEHCPTQAVTMVPYINNLTLPEIRPEICIGCGACEFACPVRPYKAIYVDGHAVHQVAMEPESEALEQPDMEEEFPF